MRKILAQIKIRPLTILILLIAWLLTFTSCAKETATSVVDQNKAAAAPTLNRAIDVQDASSAQCQSGGKVYGIFIDANQNGVFDADETVLSSQVVCNGQNGANGIDGINGANGSNGTNGYSTLFSLTRVATGFASCVSGGGLQINSGLDLNRNGSLDASEITQAQILCDGQSGAAGVAGPAGQNGHGVVFQMTAAPAAICPAGGTVILMAIDASDSGVYSATAPGQQSLVICNGVNGTNGTNGADGVNGRDGVIPAYAPVEPILPCGNTVAFKEVLLRLSNGQVLASFSETVSGQMTRLTFLPDGSYMDTDNSSCTFAISTSPDGRRRSMSWFGTEQLSWAMSP